MGLLDYVDPDALRGKLKGLLGEMPISRMARGDASVSMAGLKDALMGIPAFDQASGERDMAYSMDAIGPMGFAGMFAGAGAKTANSAALKAAQKLDKAGANRANHLE